MDTNVLYAGLYSSRGASFRVLRAIEAGTVAIVLSTTLLFEYEAVLKNNGAILGLTDGEIEKILNYVCLRGEHQKIHFLWRPLLPDPKDDHLLEVAVASGTHFIVTHNIRDFRGAGEFGIRPTTPRQLIEEVL